MRRHSHARLTISYSVLFYLDLFNLKKFMILVFIFLKIGNVFIMKIYKSKVDEG